jgi:hypothetical protein
MGADFGACYGAEALGLCFFGCLLCGVGLWRIQPVDATPNVSASFSAVHKLQGLTRSAIQARGKLVPTAARQQ